ncbi:MAG: hypothetical protein RMI49_03525 [Candidatus Caldarchaeum sp.]|nr:hypothetical protein [Candidatus Caldarchaeum sp.]
MTRRRHQLPVPIKVEDLASLARLLSSRWDVVSHLLAFRSEEKTYISYLQTMPFGKISLPMLFYAELLERPKRYVVYTPLGKEETRFSDLPETGRYVSYPVLEAEPPPEIFRLAIEGPRQRKISGLETIRVKDLESLMSLVSAMTDEAISPPLWCYRKDAGYGLAVLYPVYEYYDSAALPLLYHTELVDKPKTPFIAYSPTEKEKIRYSDSVSDSRYVYGRIVYLERFPLEI